MLSPRRIARGKAIVPFIPAQASDCSEPDFRNGSANRYAELPGESVRSFTSTPPKPVVGSARNETDQRLSSQREARPSGRAA